MGIASCKSECVMFILFSLKGFLHICFMSAIFLVSSGHCFFALCPYDICCFSQSQLYYDLQNNQTCNLHKADKYNPCKFSLYLWEVVSISPLFLLKKNCSFFAGGVNNVFIKYDWFISLLTCLSLFVLVLCFWVADAVTEQ